MHPRNQGIARKPSRRPLDGRIGIRWVGPLLDGSGYAEASRNYVAALHTVGVNLVLHPVSFERARTDYGRAGAIVNSLLGRSFQYALNVVHLTPHHFPLYREDGCFNIGFFAWETDSLPREWVSRCNLMDELWVPCHRTADLVRHSGVSKPIRVFGHCATPEDFTRAKPLRYPGIEDQAFKFYSVFQWTERKNPRGLLHAYLTAFTDEDPVVLMLKTYRSNYSIEEQNAVREEIRKIKGELGGTHAPRVVLIPYMLTREQMLGFHQLGDCFVLLQRGEGWGLPHFEACWMGKPVITTGVGGNLEFTRPAFSYLVDSTPVPVQGMPWIRWYSRRSMTWAEPDILEARSFMRHVYRHRAEASDKGRAARRYVQKRFSWDAVGRIMRARLVEICSSL